MYASNVWTKCAVCVSTHEWKTSVESAWQTRETNTGMQPTWVTNITLYSESTHNDLSGLLRRPFTSVLNIWIVSFINFVVNVIPLFCAVYFPHFICPNFTFALNPLTHPLIKRIIILTYKKMIIIYVLWLCIFFKMIKLSTTNNLKLKSINGHEIL